MVEIKTRIRFGKMKSFVKQHPTFSACVATAAVTHRITYIRTLRGVMSGMTETVYEWGREAGKAKTERDVLYMFVNEQGLALDLHKFITDFKRSHGIHLL